MGRLGWTVCIGGYFCAFFGTGYALEHCLIPKKGACERLHELQKKRNSNGSAKEQLLWMKKVRELEEQCLLETTKETVERLQAQLKQDAQRWGRKYKK